MMDKSLPDMAVFIDGDWLYYTARRLHKEIDYSSFWDILHEYFGIETPIYFFGSYDPQNQEQTKFLALLKDLGYLVEVTKLKRKKDVITVKGLDVSLAVRATSLPPTINTIVLISGDGDFVPLLEALRQNGKNTVVASIPASSHTLLVAANHNFINLEELFRQMESSGELSGGRSKVPRVIPPKSVYIEKGEYFAPYLVIRDLFLSAKTEIILIDPYINDQVLQMVHLLPSHIIIRILTNRISPTDFCVLVAKLRNEGYRIAVQKTDAFHDRFLCIDGEWWHSGHSFKDLGGKDSLISRIEDNAVLKKLQDRVQIEINNNREFC